MRGVCEWSWGWRGGRKLACRQRPPETLSLSRMVMLYSPSPTPSLSDIPHIPMKVGCWRNEDSGSRSVFWQRLRRRRSYLVMIQFPCMWLYCKAYCLLSLQKKTLDELLLWMNLNWWRCWKRTLIWLLLDTDDREVTKKIICKCHTPNDLLDKTHIVRFGVYATKL